MRVIKANESHFALFCAQAEKDYSFSAKDVYDLGVGTVWLGLPPQNLFTAS